MNTASRSKESREIQGFFRITFFCLKKKKKKRKQNKHRSTTVLVVGGIVLCVNLFGQSSGDALEVQGLHSMTLWHQYQIQLERSPSHKP